MVLPVPSDGLFTIDFNQPVHGKVEISVYNLVGQEIYRDEIHVSKPGSYLVDISRHSKGVYSVRVNATSMANSTEISRSFLMIVE